MIVLLLLYQESYKEASFLGRKKNIQAAFGVREWLLLHRTKMPRNAELHNLRTAFQ